MQKEQAPVPCVFLYLILKNEWKGFCRMISYKRAVPAANMSFGSFLYHPFFAVSIAFFCIICYNKSRTQRIDDRPNACVTFFYI